MSQAQNESFNTTGSDNDEDHNRSGSTSGSTSGSDSDSDGSSSSGSSHARSSPEHNEDEHKDNSQRTHQKSPPTNTDIPAEMSKVAGLPPTAADAQEDNKTNVYSDENESDSESNSDSESDSNDDDENEKSSPTKSNAASENENNTSHNSSRNTTKTDNNTSNATTNEEDNEDEESNNASNEENDSEEDNDDEKSNFAASEVAAETTTSERLAAEEEEDDDEEASDSSESQKSSASVEDDESATASSSDNSEEEEEDDYQPKRSTRQVRKPATEKQKAPAKKKRSKQNWDSGGSEDSNDDSDESIAPRRKTGTAKNNKQKQQKRSKKKYSSDESDDGDESKRSNKRRTAAAVSYKEASEDEQTDSEDLVEVEYEESQTGTAAGEEEEKCETIERIVAKRYGKKGCTGNQTTIYAIEDNGCDPNEGVEDKEGPDTELQYHIKWKGWSYIHNTWESETSLHDQKVKGLKKLDNFIKKEQEIDYWKRCAGPEDIDYFECQLELQNDLLKSYNNVDRIIARNEKAEGTSEYLCKWESLPYSEATWEDSSLVTRKWQSHVEQFEDRENSKCTPSRHSKVLRHRPKFVKIKSQPDFLCEGLSLRDYQIDGLNWLLHSWCKDNSVILADEMGLGKTIQTICFLYALFKHHHLYGPFLCVVPLSTMTAWQREFVLWAPEMNVVTYLGDVKSREMLRQYEWQFDGSKRLKFNCILTTYEIVLKDKLFLGTVQWSALLVDEAHRLKNDDSLLYKSLKEFDTNHRLLITGTPLQNSLKELWALLHFIMPEKFITWEDFESEHGNAADKGYARLHQQLEPFIIRRVKKDVEKSLPAKVEQILRVEMTSLQKQYYKWILTKNFDALRKGKKGSTSTFLNIVIELKKCCNHAALIRPSEFELMGMVQDEALQTLLKGSGKLVLLDKLLCRLKETGHRVLIFSQMVRMLDILADYLQKRHFSFQRLDGSIKGEIRRQALDHFNAEGSQDFCFLLSTRAGGLGINLATADTVIIFDSDWNPQNDLQAQARAHRIGQKNQVNIYRLVTARSVEEQIVERAKQKMVLDHLVIQRMDTTGRTVLDKSGGHSSNSTPFNKDDLTAILKFGAEELFKDEQEHDDELVCDIDEILRRAETRNEDPEMPGDDLLSAFKVASIAAFEEEPTETTKDNNAVTGEEEDTKDWDDIIPTDFRRVVEDEERAKEMEDLYLPPRRKTATTNNDSPAKRNKKGQQADDSNDSDYDAGSDGSGEDGRPKKRGRPAMKEKIDGFTDAELRRFIRSYKKFPAPMLRLEAIACDAELQEKPLTELQRIGEMLHDRCVQFFKEQSEASAAPPKTANDDGSKQKKGRQTYSVKLGGVSFNAKTLLTCEEELKPLNEIIPSTADERLSWALNIKTRPANFDIEWGVDDDSKLLCGIYQYGIGSWEQMKMDPSLKLTDKILFNDARKPQAKHLQSRSEYLLKVIKKNVELKKGAEKKQRKPRKPKQPKAGGVLSTATTDVEKSRNISESHGEEVSQSGEGTVGKTPKNRESTSKADADTEASQPEGETTAKKKTKRAASGKAAKAKKVNATDSTNKPMHFTANNEPRALEVLGDLDPNIFNECKEKMRPVKKALKALDRPDSSLSNQDQVKHTRDCLISIGKQIDICLDAYNEPDKKEWRSNLWYFVSKFTEYDAKKLFKMYKHTLKTISDSEKASAKGSSQSPVKKPKDAQKGKKENGVTKAEKDKSVKKKKKDKDKAKEKEKEKEKVKERDKPKSERFVAKGGAPTDRGSFEKIKRLSLESPAKRKYDESEAAGGGVVADKSLSFKRINMDGAAANRNRNNSDERKKHPRDDYYNAPNSNHDRRVPSVNSPSTLPNRGLHAGGIKRLPPGSGGGVPSGAYSNANDNRNNSSFVEGDRWGHGRDRYGAPEYKRERYDGYNSGNYNRDRDRNRRPEKRRYNAPPPHSLNYSGHYMPPYYMANGGVLPPPNAAMPHSGYRGDPRSYPPGSTDWPRDGRAEYASSDYRRSDYDRRSQT